MRSFGEHALYILVEGRAGDWNACSSNGRCAPCLADGLEIGSIFMVALVRVASPAARRRWCSRPYSIRLAGSISTGVPQRMFCLRPPVAKRRPDVCIGMSACELIHLCQAKVLRELSAPGCGFMLFCYRTRPLDAAGIITFRNAEELKFQGIVRGAKNHAALFIPEKRR